MLGHAISELKRTSPLYICIYICINKHLHICTSTPHAWAHFTKNLFGFQNCQLFLFDALRFRSLLSGWVSKIFPSPVSSLRPSWMDIPSWKFEAHRIGVLRFAGRCLHVLRQREDLVQKSKCTPIRPGLDLSRFWGVRRCCAKKTCFTCLDLDLACLLCFADTDAEGDKVWSNANWLWLKRRCWKIKLFQQCIKRIPLRHTS